MNNITKPNGEQQPIYAGGRVVGEVHSAVFNKRIKGSLHMLRKPRAIALDVDSLRQAKEYGAATIRITDTESGAVYSCDMAHFYRHSFLLNRGYGEQRAMILDRWTVTGANAKNTPLPIAETKAVQYSMFEAV